MHIFDFYLFSKITATVYRDLKSPFSLDEVLDIFDYFFQAYEEAMGEPHPAIRREQIRNIIERMPYTGREGCGFDNSSVFFSPEDYPAMIDNYFSTDFDKGCNYRINHFFSGAIRELRAYEEIY